jgi:hypothetical protein
MMDDDAILAEVLALLQQKSCEQCCGGASHKRWEKAPLENTPTTPDACL